MDVPWELVAQKDLCQRAVGRLLPMIQVAGHGELEQVAEAVTDLAVEFRRALPPDVARLAVAGVAER